MHDFRDVLTGKLSSEMSSLVLSGEWTGTPCMWKMILEDGLSRG